MAGWGQARKDVLSNKPLILQRIVEGCSIRSIYMELSSDGRVSVALRNFHSQVRKLMGQEAEKSASGHRQLVRVAQPAAPSLFPASTIGQSVQARGSAANAEPAAERDAGILSPELNACFGNTTLPHNPRATSVRGKRLEADEEGPNQSKEQKNAG